jgi:hypothetical protein
METAWRASLSAGLVPGAETGRVGWLGMTGIVGQAGRLMHRESVQPGWFGRDWLFGPPKQAIRAVARRCPDP